MGDSNFFFMSNETRDLRVTCTYIVFTIAHIFISIFSHIMAGYLGRQELNQLLQNEWFTQFESFHVHNYALYRGRVNATVLTLRYNIESPQFDQETMIENVIRRTMQQFSNEPRIVGLIEYDLLLRQPDMESFYIWRANSNVARHLPNAEQTIVVGFDELYLYIRNALQMNPVDLNVYFRSSNVTIEKIIAVVFTFCSF